MTTLDDMTPADPRSFRKAVTQNHDRTHLDVVTLAKNYNLLLAEVREMQDRLEKIEISTPVDPDGT